MACILNRIYWVSGVVAGALIVAICLLISAQIVLNGVGRIAPGVLPSTIPSYADFSGFMLAGATFLALPHTLRAGGHIRVNLVTQRFPDRWQVLFEGFVLVTALALIGYVTVYMALLIGESWHYGDVSTGIVPVALWWPQTVVCAGLVLMWVALAHTLGELVQQRRPVLSTPDEA